MATIAAGTGAGVRKPPRKETAGSEAAAGVARYGDLTAAVGVGARRAGASAVMAVLTRPSWLRVLGDTDDGDRGWIAGIRAKVGGRG